MGWLVTARKLLCSAAQNPILEGLVAVLGQQELEIGAAHNARLTAAQAVPMQVGASSCSRTAKTWLIWRVYRMCGVGGSVQ